MVYKICNSCKVTPGVTCVCVYIKVVITLHYIEGILLNYGEDLPFLLHDDISYT